MDSDAHNNRSFSEAFAPLAHHLFPDGCPLDDLDDVWPHRQDRTTVSHKDARVAILKLRKCGPRIGFTALEQRALVQAACSTLPSFNDETVVLCSPLVDGTSGCFRSILRCLIPQKRHCIPREIVCQLLSLSSLDSLGKACVFRFLTLAVRSRALDAQARSALSSLYPVVLNNVSDTVVCSDAVRLLYSITLGSHVRVYRAKRLHQCLYNNDDETKKVLMPIGFLLELYAQYSPVECGIYSTKKMRSDALARFLSNVDADWESDLTATEEPDTTQDDGRLHKQCCTSAGWLQDRSLWTNEQPFSLESKWKRASDWLMDDNQRHEWLFLKKTDPARVRFRTCLPYMLYEEWYPPITTRAPPKSALESDSEESFQQELLEEQRLPMNVPAHRTRLLQAIASWVSHTGSLPWEIESFLVYEVLPTWDGTDRYRAHLCIDLLPHLEPREFPELHSKVLCHFEQLCLYGTPDLFYSIVSDFLTGLIRNWSVHPSWSTTTTRKRRRTSQQEEDPVERKHQALQDLIHWVDNLLLKRFLVGCDDHVRLSALDFFTTVCNHCPVVMTPSPGIVYRLLLSKTAWHVDQSCQLLLCYRGVFQRLKDEEGANEKVRERIAVFNCFVWDFCSVLWRNSPLPEKTDRNDMSILFKDLSPALLQELGDGGTSVASALSITHGAVFSEYAFEFLQQQSPGHQAVSQLQGKLKVKYLDYLGERGLTGIYEFLSTCVKSLANRKARKQMQIQTQSAH